MKNAWLAVLAVAHLAQAQFSGCPDSLCPEGSCNCTCDNGHLGNFDLYCPMGSPLVHPSLLVNVLPGQGGSVEIKCTSAKSATDYELLRGLNLGSRKRFLVRLCPLPTVPFKQLMMDTGVNNVQDLTVQSFANYSNHLTRSHFSGLGDIASLTLINNMLTELPEDLFLDTGNLTWLNMRDNLLRMPKNIFRPVPKLEVLELGSNNLTYLEPGIFRNLTKLRLLNLWGNRLKNLSRSLFSDLTNLEALDLNSNRLTTLPPDIFSDLPKLKKINLHGNSFSSLPQGLFLSNTLLEIFQLNYNRVELKVIPPGLLSNLPRLQEVIMHHCNISSLPEYFIWNSPSITNFTMSWNRIGSLPANLFRDNPNLLEIDLTHNQITSVPDQLFIKQQKLVKLQLSHNRIQNITASFFDGLESLTTLDLSHNNISFVARKPFPSSLNHVDLSWNEISNLTYIPPHPPYKMNASSVFMAAVRISSLQLSHNRLTQIYSDWLRSLSFLKEIDLSYNNISFISSEDIDFNAGPKVDLSYNSISIVAFNDIETAAHFKFDSIPTTELVNFSTQLSLKGNPLTCDCNAYGLMRLLRREMSPNVNYLVEVTDASDLICHAPLILHSKAVRDVEPSQVNCEWVGADTEEGIRANCPQNCSCRYRPYNSALLIDCSHKGLTSWPKTLPPSSAANANHTEVYLFNNHLTEVPRNLDPSYRNVTHLYLSDNKLASINLTYFSPHLRVLELNDNNLTSLGDSLETIEKLKDLSMITLWGNPWRCDCESKRFVDFVKKKFDKVSHKKNITCGPDQQDVRLNNFLLVDLSDTDLCPISAAAIFIGITVAVLGLLIGGLCAVYYRYQKEIKVWLYANRMCLWFVTEDELDKDKRYDAFISYSHQDESFVVNELVRVLENNSPKYKLCLHYRDWIVGDFIPNQIARSVEESRRTVVVLSPSFIESVWGRMEFRTAHQQALTERRARVIIILYGDIGDTEKLDPELKAYLAMNTYVKWGDPWFWDKLLYALPHPPEITKGIPSLCRRRPKSQPKKGNEKLVVTTENGTTTTPPALNIIEPLKTLSNTKPI